MEENGIERTDKTTFFHPTPKYPAGPKYPALSITLNTQHGKNPLALGHGTAWNHYKMKNFLHPTLKYPAALKISSSVDTQLEEILWLWNMGQDGTTIKMKNFLHPILKYPVVPKIPTSVDTTKYPTWNLFVDIP